MNIDFALVLVIGVGVTGFLWLVDYFWFAKTRSKVESGTESNNEPILIEYAKFLFPVFLIVLLLRGFIAEPFRIPSGSMLPTLEIGDFILVNKFSYGLRLPVTNKRLIEISSPERGDVIVFRYPEKPSIDYIKRVVGIPGDKVAYYNKVLYINDKPAVQQPDGNYMVDFQQFKKFSEQYDDINHKILVNRMLPAADFVDMVPPNKYFVMGDNRDNSRDSRFWGFVPEENLVGKAFLVWMNWRWGEWPQLTRVGTVIR